MQLPEPQAARLLADYAVGYPDHRFVTSPLEVAEAAAELGCPVVVKVVSPAVIHKSDVGAVLTGIATSDEAQEAAEGMRRAMTIAGAETAIDGYLVCRQAGAGHEVIVGGLRDLTFGPAVMLGMGGVLAELLDDVAFRLAPVDPPQVMLMLEELRGFPVLKGARGGLVGDLDALALLVARVSRLLVDRRDIVEIDLNPVRVDGESCLALDARIILADQR